MDKRHDVFKDLVEQVSIDANEILDTKLSEKIMEMEKMMNELRELNLNVSPSTYIPTCEEIEASAGMTGKKRKVEETGAVVCTIDVPANREIKEQIKTLGIKITESIEMLGTVKTWIQLNIPKIEDGNNFGVAVQEECVGEISRVEDAGFNIMESTSKYFQSRAKLVQKLLKYPKIHDFRQAVVECDESQLVTLLMSVIDLRNSYAFIQDLLAKNLDKLIKPRNHHTHSMY